MTPDSVFFLSIFLPLCLAIYWLIPPMKGKNAVLLVASLVFYSFGSLAGLLILLGCALVNFLLGLWVSGRKGLMILGVALNLALLAFYKYLDFTFSNILGLPQLQLGLAAPLGISFFTFKSISYLVDTWRDKENGSRSFWDVLLYLSFFPQVVAGPIARFRDFAPQLTDRSITLENAAGGIRRFVIGLAKKLIMAGTLGNVVDTIFRLEGGVPDLRLAWLAAIGYSLQIYFDFSGYSDMAIGLGQAFGFTTKENFQYPYIATTLGNFWRRWHISLSSWFKDYLYIPLGGNRKGTLRAGLNKLIVFTLCGIWHGAAWTLVVWGLWHGLLSMLESLNVIPAKKLESSCGMRILGRVYTLLVVCLGFVMFRATSLEQGFGVIGTMFTGFTFTDSATVLLHRLLSGENVVILLLGILLAMPVKNWVANNEKLGKVLEPVSYAAALVLLVLCIGKLASGGFAPFIYGQF